MTDEQLAEIEARAEALRDGPRVFHDREELRRYQEAHDRSAEDMAALVAEVRRLWAENDSLRRERNANYYELRRRAGG